MKKTRVISLLTLLALVCVAFAACSSKPKEKKAEPAAKGAAPIAQVRQKVKTPTLALPTAPPPEKKESKAPEPKPAKGPRTTAEGKQPAAKPPEGPITVPKPPELRPLPPSAHRGASRTSAVIEGEISALPAPVLGVTEEPAAQEPSPVQYEPKLVTAKTNVDILLDASGSMSAPSGFSTESKFDLLEAALLEVIYEVRQQQAAFPRNIAVRLFGSKSETGAKDCEDTELLIGMGEPNLNAIAAALEKARPKGQSPIAFALKQAMDDFPLGIPVDRVIVLVADGADTCGADLCETANEIARSRAKTAVNVVAFDVSSEDREKLDCLAKKTDGQLFLARNEAELQAALDQAINSTVPYNLKLSAQAGGAPLPFTIAVYRAGTNEVVRKGQSLGTKLLNLPAGTYDILVEYIDSPELKKPSKILKGVEVLGTTKVEQTINFNLSRLSIIALSNEGRPVPAVFKITSDGGKAKVASVETGAGTTSFFLPPGTYDIAADLVETGPEPFTVIELGVELNETMQPDLSFIFQKGTLALKGLTTLGKPIPFVFHAFKAGSKEIVASGALPSEGGSVQLAPGNCDLIVIGDDPNMTASPRTRIGGVVIRAAETTELTAMFEMGTMTLSAKDGKGNPVPAEFVVKDEEIGVEMVRATTTTGAPIDISVPPGTYTVTAYSIKSILEPKPSVIQEGLVVVANQPTKKVLTFVLGTLRLRGRNAKEQAVRTQFTIYKSGSDEIAAKAPPANDWMIFDLAPGLYDALSTAVTEEVFGEDNTRPMIWIRDIKIEDGKTVSHEAIFTAGKLKVIGRGSNNRIIMCAFKVFHYGSDTALIKGQTTNDWEIFEIEPGKYYVEASYVDDEQDVTLKKWVNVNVGENEVVELVLRF